MKGIVVYKEGHSGYVHIAIDNLKDTFLLTLSRKIVFEHPKYYILEKGDSILKNANTDTITIKNKKGRSTYLINCSEY